MIELSTEIIITIIFVLAILGGVLTGYPIAIALGAVGFIIGYFMLGPPIFELMYIRIYGMLLNYPILAVPLFVFMGLVLGSSGIADRLYGTLFLLFGGFRGGLAIGTVLIGTVLAACLGIITASVTMLAIVALSPMLNRGYSKSLATGSICAGGTLGILIPPSVMLVFYGPIAGISVGKLFMGAIFPGLVLSGLYCIYIAIRALLQPQMAPVVPAEERKASLRKKTIMLLTSLFPPAILILSVLGTIFFGIAPPTEAAGVGACAAVLLAIGYRKFNWEILKDCALQTLRITSFALLIACLAFAAVGVFMRLGCGHVIGDLILAAPFGRWGAFAAVMLTIFILGMFMGWLGIIFIVVPIITPLVPILGFDPVWFALMVCINLQMAFMTPPMALAIFVCKGAAPPELGVTMADIIRGVIPFVVLIMVGIGLCIAFPEIILWLPGKMIVKW